MQRNTRNPYSSSQNRSRSPYSSAGRRPSAPQSQSGSSTRRPASNSRPQSAGYQSPYRYNRSGTSQTQTGRNPYGYTPSRTGVGANRPADGNGYHLTSAGKVVVLALALILIFGAVFGISRLIGGGSPRKDIANVPVKSDAIVAENTQAPLTDDAQTSEESVSPDSTQEPPAQTGAEEAAAAETPLPEAATPQPGNNASATGLRSATIRSIGDFVIHEPIYKSAKTEDGYDFTPMLTYIKESMGDADYTVANVDGPMGGAGKRGYKGYPQFNTPPQLMLALQDAGVDMLTLANNHALDTYFDGLKAEIEACISIGMDYVGAARTQEEHDTPVIKEINGIKVGFLNYTQSTNTMEKYSDSAAVEYGLNIARYADFEADAQAARDAGAEVLVAYMHWGEEYERNPGSDQQSYGKKLVAAGVDVIIGGHPHVVQPAYWLEGTRTSDGGTQRTLCLSSLGNFLSDQRAQYRDGGIMFDFTIQEVSAGEFEIINPQYIPTYVWRTGNDDAGYEYRVVPCGPYLNDAPDGMDSESHARLVEVWYETIEHMNTGNAGATVLEK